MDFSPAFLNLGWQETMVIFVLALLIFGPKKLPELGKTLGKAITEFRRASSELKSTWDREVANLERESESLKELKEISSSYQSELNDYSSSYSYEGSSHEPDSHGSAAAKPAGEEAEAVPKTAVADSGGPDAVPTPPGLAEGVPASESKTIAG